MRKKTTILSDVGNVVADFDNERTVRALAPFSTATSDDIRAGLFGPEGLCRRYASGELDTDAFRRTARRDLGILPMFTDRRFDAAFSEVFVPNVLVIGLWSLMRIPPTNMTITALSDMEELRETELRRMGVMHVFDHEVLSYQEGECKPSTELLVRALDRSGASAEEAVYIDDLERNLFPARKLGIATHLYRGFPALLDFLEGQGIDLKMD